MKIAKRSKQPSAKTGQIGPSIPSAKSGENPSLSANLKGSDMQITARLRSAKKGVTEAQAPREKKLEGEVSLGPTEVSVEKQGYINRLKKRGAK